MEFTEIDIRRIMNFVKETRKQTKFIERFTAIVPITLHTLQSIEPKNDDFAYRLGNYIDVLKREIANPIINLTKKEMDRLEEACRESPDTIPMAYYALREILPSTFIYYEKMIHSRIHIFKRAETEGERRTLPEAEFPPIPEKGQLNHQEREESNVKSLRAKRARADLEKLKKATDRYDFHSKVLAGNLRMALRNQELFRLTPELLYIAQEYADSANHIMREMKDIHKHAEIAIEEMEYQPIESQNNIVLPESKKAESDEKE